MKIQLKNQEVEVVECEKCSKNMVNLDADQLAVGDLTTLKQAGVTVSNPNTEDQICVNCEHRTFGRKVADFFESDNDDDDDSSFFGGSSFGGSDDSSSGGFSGFGGGSFSGGGASSSW